MTTTRTVTPRACVDCGKAIRTYTPAPRCHPCRAIRRGTVAALRPTRQSTPVERRVHRRRDANQRSTTDRGYGWKHQQARSRLIAEHVDGTSCPFCNEPMHLTQPLDVDHSNPESRLMGEPGDRLAHRSCNRRDGAARTPRPRPRIAECEICGNAFRPRHGTRTCGRVCGWELRRRNAA